MLDFFDHGEEVLSDHATALHFGDNEIQDLVENDPVVLFGRLGFLLYFLFDGGFVVVPGVFVVEAGFEVFFFELLKGLVNGDVVVEWVHFLKEDVVILEQEVKGVQNLIFHLEGDEEEVDFEVLQEGRVMSEDRVKPVPRRLRLILGLHVLRKGSLAGKW